MAKKKEIHVPADRPLVGWTVEEAIEDEEYYIDPELLEEIKQRLIENIEETKNNLDTKYEQN